MSYDKILADDKRLSKIILDEMYPNDPFDDVERYKKALKDIEWALLFTVEGLKAKNKKIVENLLIWLERLFIGLDIGQGHVTLLFDTMKRVLHEEFNSSEIDDFLSSINVLQYTNIASSPSNPLQRELDLYVEALLKSDRVGAKKIVDKLYESGTSIEDIYINLLQEAMRTIGNMWHDGEIHVAREHYSTAVTQFIMSTLYPYIFSLENNGKKILASAVGSELHEIGIRMVADIFELHGWDTNYLGANLPANELIAFAEEFKPDVIALSITMPYHVSTLRNTIQEIRKHPTLNACKIIVGGLPFIENESLVESVGADAFASDAKEGVKVANALLE